MNLRNWYPVLAPFILSRSLIFLIILTVSQLQIFRHQAWEGEVISPHVELGSQEILPNLKRILSSGDARWYLDIAENGYDFSDPEVGKMRNWVFFPLVPCLIDLFSTAVGSKILAGILLSNICYFLFLTALQGICKEERFSDEQTENILWLTAFFPVSYFFSVPITESVFAACLAGGYLYLKRREYLICSILLALAALTRPTGILILPAFLIAIFQNGRPSLKQLVLFFLPAGIAILGIASFYLLNTGDPLAFAHNQVYWDRNGSALSLIKNLPTHYNILVTGWNFTALNFITLIVASCAVVSFLQRKEYDFAAMVFLPLAAAVNTGTLLAMIRISMPLFPIIFFISRFTKGQKLERAILVIFAALLGIMTLLYSLHVTPAMA